LTPYALSIREIYVLASWWRTYGAEAGELALKGLDPATNPRFALMVRGRLLI